MKFNVRLKKPIDPAELQSYGFKWTNWEPEAGATCYNGAVTICTNSREVKVSRTTQKACDIIVKLAIAGFLEFYSESPGEE